MARPSLVILILAVLLVIGASSSLVLLHHPAGNSSPSTSSSSSITEPTNISTSLTADLKNNVSMTNPINGLQLSLSLNATSVQIGEGITIAVSEYNTYDTVNNVSSSDNWAMGGLGLPPCSPPYPVGIAILEGYYTSANISAAARSALAPYSPGPYGCGGGAIVWENVRAYIFLPMNNTVGVSGVCVPGTAVSTCLTDKIASEIMTNGYWYNWNTTSYNNAKFSNFASGIYTVVTGDEWGQLEILYFLVI